MLAALHPGRAGAAITEPQPWTTSYSAAGFPTSFNVTVNSASSRILVVAVTSAVSTSGTQTCSVTYGGTALTSAGGDGTTTAFSHTWLFYMTENTTLMNGTARALVATVTGGTSAWATVNWAVYAGADTSASPIRQYTNYNSGTTTVTSPAFGTGLTITAGDQAVEAVNLYRTGSGTPRTISAWATGWSVATGGSAYPQGGANGTTNATNVYINEDATAATTTAGHTTSGTAYVSKSAMAIKAAVPDTVVGNGTNPLSSNGMQGTTNHEVDSFTVAKVSGTGTLSTVVFTGSAQFTSANVSSVKLYQDAGTLGLYEPGVDTLLTTTTSWATNVATITVTGGLAMTTTPVNVLVAVDVAAAATPGNTLSGTVSNVTGTGITVVDDQDTSSATVTITTTGLNVLDGTNPANASAIQTSTNNAVDSFVLSMGTGTSTVSTLTLTNSAQFTTTNVSAVRLYRDNGTIGAWDAADVLVPTTGTIGTSMTLTITTPEPVSTTPVNYIIVVDVAAAATNGNTLTSRVTAATGTGIGTPLYSDSASATLTIATLTTTVGNGIDPPSVNAQQGSAGHEQDAFTVVKNYGTGTLSTLTLTTSAQFTTTNVAAVQIYRDSGTIGTLDAADTLVPATGTIAATTMTVTFTTPEPVSTTAQNYLIVVNVQGAATVGNTLTARVTGMTGTNLGTVTATGDTAGATLTVVASGLTVTNSIDPVSGSAPTGATGLALDAFNLDMSLGSGSVSTLTFTGSAQFVSTNVSAIRIYRDNGVVGTYESGTDVLVATTTAWATNVATITFTTAEPVTTTGQNYLLVIDVAAAAAIGASLSGTVTGATGTTLGTPVYADTGSAALTVILSGLAVSDSTAVASSSAPQGSLRNVMNSFRFNMGLGSGSVSTMTLTGSAQLLAANVAAIKVYRDNGQIGALDAMDVLVPINAPTWATNVATLTFTAAEPVTTTVASYLVVIDVAAAATVGNTLSGTITAATGTGVGTPAYSDTTSGVLTVSAGATLTVGNGATLAAANAPVGTPDNLLDSFTTVLGAAATGQLTGLAFSGSANFTTTNIANVKVYADNGTVGTLDRTDRLIPSTYTQAGTVATITFASAEAVSNTTRNYFVLVDLKSGAVVAQTFTGTVTAAVGSGYVGASTYSDTASATLTITKAPSATLSCAQCHGYTNLFPDGTARNVTDGTFPGSHYAHVGEYSMPCSACHVIPATETSADYLHRTGIIQMATTINGDTGGAYGKGATWTQTNSPTAFQACSSVYCHSQGVSGTGQAGDRTTMSAPVTSLNWGSVGQCDSCHGYPPSYANGATTWGTAKANSHAVHTSHCETCHNGSTATGDSITTPALHANKAYNIAAGNGEAIASYTYAATGGTCTNISCHGGADAGGGIGTGQNNAAWGALLDCTTCHNKEVNAPRAKALSASVMKRRNVVGEFASAWSHKRSAGGAVTKWDCIVCHMEGSPASGDVDYGFHGNGKIELRDPDSGSQIRGVTFTDASGAWGATTSHTGAGSYASTTTPASFVQFSRNLAQTLEADPNGLTVAAIQFNQCLKCHDSTGAASVAARVPGGSAMKPFNTTITGHTAPPVSRNGLGNVLDVNGQFATTNATYHPIRGRQNNSYTQGTTQMVAPWTMAKTNGNATQFGYLLSCWDCHALPAEAGLTLTKSVTAHGAASTIIGPVKASGTTCATNLCICCHAAKYSSTTHVSTGSAVATGPDTGAMGNSYWSNCAYCHANGPANATNYQTSTARPLRADDAHGFDDRDAATVGSLFLTTGAKPHAFFRGSLEQWRPASGTGITAGSATCRGTGGTCNSNMSGQTYTPGGAF
ncbi:MAG TPA: CxxxxCH/CxxCH domain-containing protein [Myxococcales bacterium]